MNNQFYIFNVNIRSSRANFDFFIHYTDALKQKFSVFTLTKTWLKHYNKNLYNLKGYKHIFKVRKNKSDRGRFSVHQKKHYISGKGNSIYRLKKC